MRGVGWGVLRGFGIPPWLLWGVGGGVENTQKIHKSHRNHIQWGKNDLIPC